MRLNVFVVTVGEKIVHDAITLLHWATPVPYHLTVWYDACGRGIDWKFHDSLFKHTDDVILSSQDKTPNGIYGFASLYMDYDHLLLMTADALVKPDYFQRIMNPFKELPRVGMVGEAWRNDITEEYVVNDFQRGIDVLYLFDRRAINECGGFSPSFNGKGPSHFELQRRMVASGWSFAAVNGLCDHGGQKHEGRDKDPEWKKAMFDDDLVLTRSAMKGYRDYKWWSNAN